MRGNEKVIEQLNAALSLELTVIVEYMTQSEMQANWGYERLAETSKHRAMEEMKHAERLIERIIFLDATPVVSVGLKPRLGSNVQQQLEIDLEDEVETVHQYNDSVKVCRAAGDDASRELFKGIIQYEERHVDYLESQLSSIKDMGIANYLSKQLEGK